MFSFKPLSTSLAILIFWTVMSSLMIMERTPLHITFYGKPDKVAPLESPVELYRRWSKQNGRIGAAMFAFTGYPGYLISRQMLKK